MVLVPLKRVCVIIAWLAGQSKAHLCAASNIRAMPETEIPPVFTGGYLFADIESAEILTGWHTVKLSFVKQNGEWRLDAPTY